MKKIHTWLGLCLLIVMIWMGFSGIILNHRKLFSGSDLNRKYLPETYHYYNWNYGFIKGSVQLPGDSVLLYGNEGIWLSDIQNSFIKELNQGIREGADNRKVSRIVKNTDGVIYCTTLFQLYRLDRIQDKWIEIELPRFPGRISDIETHDNKIIVLTRSHLLLQSERDKFEIHELPASPDMNPKRSLFRFLWMLHSGELWGLTGKIVVDFIAILFIFLSISGIIMYLFPKLIKARKKKKLNTYPFVPVFRFSWKWHNKAGYWLLIPLLISVITGAFLRPPLLIAISKQQITPPPLTTMNSVNPWHDLLRTLRYDKEQKEWILYTSEGFYTLPTLQDVPRKTRYQPPVSVMGLNVLEQLDNEWWILGSFNGFIVWNRYSGEMIDGFTGRPFHSFGGIPFGQYKISGYSADFEDRTLLFLYDSGVYIFSQTESFQEMPEQFTYRPISLWNLALEMHTGRILTFLGEWNILFPFITGLLSVILLFSGWIVYRKYKRKNRK